ncbi:MAG: DsbA family protein [Anaerolineae bacterium]|nr:DsbA family protein [Anaerolineae bacterium]
MTEQNEVVADTEAIGQPEAPKDAAPVAPQTTVISSTQLTINYTAVAIVFLAIGVLLGNLIGRGSAVSISQIQLAVAQALQSADLSGSEGATARLSLQDLVDDDPALGPVDAPVTIVEFSDFNCSFCASYANNTLKQIIDRYGDSVRIVYRDMPIIGRELSVQTAIAAECADDQGKFWEFHNLIFANPRARSQEAYNGFADELGMDVTTFTSCMGDPAKIEEIQLDLLDGDSLGVSATPAFFINGRFISGAQPINVFILLIDAELTKAGVTPPPRPS